MTARRPVSLPPLLLAAVGWAVLAGCSPPSGDLREPQRLSVAAGLGGQGAGGLAGFERALEARALEFPQDHGPHPSFKTEWWYWIGNLTTAEGRRFGYQLTFFRSALAPPTADSANAARPASNWATRDLYMAHFAVSDIDGSGFRSFERFSRGAAGLAGAKAEPFRVWLEDWNAGAARLADAGGEEWLLEAREANTSVALTLAPGKPRVLHGDRGLSRKGDLPGAASYYYSHTRMPTRGRITVDGEAFEVRGESWFDREWSTSLLAADEVGWDWLGARLDDGREVMLFRLRRRDGSSARVDGTLVEAGGDFRPLRTSGFSLEAEGSWTSPETGIVYPSGFLLELPEEGLAVTVRPLLSDQELRHSFIYWEGAVELTGSAAGTGYLEMTGYGETASPR